MPHLTQYMVKPNGGVNDPAAGDGTVAVAMGGGPSGVGGWEDVKG